VLNVVGLSNAADLLIRVARWPAMFVSVALALALIYRFGPCREAPRWRWITWGSVIATILWLGASGLFSWYAASFGKFNETYGSLGAAIGFMTWLWISAIVILLGAELDAEMEHQDRARHDNGIGEDGRAWRQDGRYSRSDPRRLMPAPEKGPYFRRPDAKWSQTIPCGPPAMKTPALVK
jgi:uncharacterized BrkB/YihY/UPF0761 family membrane protein